MLAQFLRSPFDRARLGFLSRQFRLQFANHLFCGRELLVARVQLLLERAKLRSVVRHANEGHAHAAPPVCATSFARNAPSV